MRSRLLAHRRRQPLSLARITALTGTLVLQILAFSQLWLTARVMPEQRLRTAITLQLYGLEEPPPVGPPLSRPLAIAAGPVVPAIPARAEAANPVPDRAAAEPAPEDEFVPAVESVAAAPGASIEQQRAEVAAQIARENAPVRRPFRGRSIDAMLPDADKGMLPGFRPRTVDEPSKLMRKLGQMLSQGVPSAAVDPDAPLDLLTEGWEAKHHGSDLAACELQYEELDADLRRKMCGEVGRGL